MPWVARTLTAAALALAVGGNASAQEKATVAEQLSLGYDVYISGFNVLLLDLDLGLGPRSYSVTARYKTVGTIGFLFPWTSEARSEGTLGASGLAPLRHRTQGEFRGNRRSVEVDYRDGRVVDTRIEPPDRDAEEREVVTDQHRAGTRDPISTVLTVARTVGEGRGCNLRLPVYDGRRRYDLVFTEVGREKVDPTRYSPYGGMAIKCTFAYEAIAGHLKRTPGDESSRRPPTSGRAWLLPILPGAPATPVRVEVDSQFGVAYAHLREAKRVAALPTATGLAAVTR